MASNVMEAYEEQMDLVAKARKLERVSGLSIDELISYYEDIRKFAEQHADTWTRVNAVLPEEIAKILVRESEVECDET